MRRHTTMYLDITKKPGDPHAVRTSDQILAENAQLREEIAKLKSGDAAKMREALKEARRVLRKIYKPELSPLDGDNRLISATVGIINAALAAPPRNCDVGTAAELDKRFFEFCMGHSCEDDCPLRETKKAAGRRCSLAWAQMPCEKVRGFAQGILSALGQSEGGAE